MTSSSGVSPYVTQAITTGAAINHAPVCDESGVHARVRLLGPRARAPDLLHRPRRRPDHLRRRRDSGARHEPRPTLAASSTPPSRATSASTSVPFIASDGHGGTTGGELPGLRPAPGGPELPPGPDRQERAARQERPARARLRQPAGRHADLLRHARRRRARSAGSTPTAPSPTPPTRARAGRTRSRCAPRTPSARATRSRSRSRSTRASTARRSATTTRSRPSGWSRTRPRCSTSARSAPTPTATRWSSSAAAAPSHGSVTAGPAPTLTYTPDHRLPRPRQLHLRRPRRPRPRVDGRDLQRHRRREQRADVRGARADHRPPGPGEGHHPQLQRPGRREPHVPDRHAAERHAEPARRLDHPGRVYTAPASAGPDSFSYKAMSAGGESVVRTQQITVDPGFNSTPTCTPNSGFPLELAQGRATQLPITTWCEDADGDTLTFTRAVPGPAARHGHRVQRRHHLHIRPRLRSAPTRSATSPSDGHGGTVTQTFSVDVVAPAAPVCETPDPVDVRTGARRTVGLHCSDDFGDPLNFEITDPPDLGTLDPPGDGTSQFRTYTAGGAAGDDTFSYRATNASGTANIVTQVLHLEQRPPTSPRPAPATRASPRPCPVARRRRSRPAARTTTATRSATRSSPSPPTARSATPAGRSSTRRPSATPAPTSSTSRRPTATAASPRTATHHVNVVAPDPPTCAPSDRDHAAARTRRARSSSTATTGWTAS